MYSDQSIVPVQNKGARSYTSYAVRASSEQAAHQLFQNARLNLLNVNSWHTLAGEGAVFQLINEKGEQLHSLVETGNYFRISIPVIPGTREGKGDEWVYVEKVDEGKLKYHEFTAVRVRPSSPPFEHMNETAHFFSNEATSTFSVVRNGSRVMVSVSGRNEKPNTDTRNLVSRIRNLFVALGAIIGLNKPLWKSLAKGIIKKRVLCPVNNTR